jgi:acetyltransferase-like isoleucine patch superfamily enzyme
MTSGGVRIGDRVKFGAGVFVEPLLSIGSDSVVATGVALTRSVPERSIVKTRANFVVRSRDA